MKDRTFIKILIFALAMFIAISVYQVLVIRNLKSSLETVTKDRDWVIEKYNQKEKKNEKCKVETDEVEKLQWNQRTGY